MIIKLKDIFIGNTNGDDEATKKQFIDLFYNGNNKYDDIMTNNLKFIISGQKGTGKTILGRYIEAKNDTGNTTCKIINKNGADLSGGERQRICIARAMVANPDIYLFDEITSAIDKRNSEELIKIIEEISKDSIVIMTSHEELKFSKPIIEYSLIDNSSEETFSNFINE